MSTVEHAERAHALLSASGAHRWLHCPPSARLTESIPDRRSEYADEGTAAHELAEVKIRQTLLPCNRIERQKLSTKLKELQAGKFYGPEMENATQDYVRIVEERFMEAKSRSEDAVILLEERLDYSEWAPPDNYGTGDVVLIADGVLEVIDLKYGKGVPVSAVENPQIRLYGLGAWSAWNYLYDIREVRMTIIQPRLDSVSTDSMPIDSLLEWGETVVKPAAILANAGEGEFHSGEHCRWCKVKATCRARAEENMKALEYEFRDPRLFTLEELGNILVIAEQLSTWSKDVQDFAFEQAKSGKKVPHWKLVEGRSNRTIVDKEVAKSKLEAAGIEADKYLKPHELFGITDLEKNIGKKELVALIGDLIEKPKGKPVLVSETDKRPELNSLENDFANESFE